MKTKLRGTHLIEAVFCTVAMVVAPGLPVVGQIPLYPGAEERIIYESKMLGTSLYIDRIKEDNRYIYLGLTNSGSDSVEVFRSCGNSSMICLSTALAALVVPRQIRVGMSLVSGQVRSKVMRCMDDNISCENFYIVSGCVAYNYDYDCSQHQYNDPYQLGLRFVHMIYNTKRGVVSFGYSANADDDIIKSGQFNLVTKSGLLSEGFQ